MSLFARLVVYQDNVFRSAALNMAIDEALLETAIEPAIRFYRWNSPALSFGYFGRFASVASHRSERDVVRRWTGGGIVLHGQDLTYSIVVPANSAAAASSSAAIYDRVHRGLRDALRTDGHRAELADTNAPVISSACFTSPVRADVLLHGQKIAGAAQRRTRRGLLQQGSIQNVAITNGLADRFASALCDSTVAAELSVALLERAAEIAARKYASADWLQRR